MEITLAEIWEILTSITVALEFATSVIIVLTILSYKGFPKSLRSATTLVVVASVSLIFFAVMAMSSFEKAYDAFDKISETAWG
jgi:hypothetical protein